MKASGSPCPLDQISIICFKRCPFLRTVITRIFRIIWTSGHIPHEWKKACTILVHKKGNSDDPANFRPITLETVPLKIFTSCLRDSFYSFLTQNGLIEQKIQKGFTHGVSGVLEHTSMMAFVINKARLKQRSIIVTLLDLKNAFGEVHHNLIKSVLEYHHIPESLQLLIANLYTDFHSHIISDSFSTPVIPFNRGVLQGDCLSPLIFNLCFNTFIQFIKQESIVVTSKHCNLGHFILKANFLLFIHSHSQITHLGHDHTSLLSSHTWSFLFCCSLRNHHTMSQFNKQLTTT